MRKNNFQVISTRISEYWVLATKVSATLVFPSILVATYDMSIYVYVDSFVTPVASFTKKYPTTDNGSVYREVANSVKKRSPSF